MTYLFIFITHIFIILLVPHNCFSFFKYCTFLIFLVVLYLMYIDMDYLSEINIYLYIKYPANGMFLYFGNNCSNIKYFQLSFSLHGDGSL